MIIVEGGREAFSALSSNISYASDISDAFISSLSEEGMRSFNNTASRYQESLDKLEKAGRSVNALVEEGGMHNPLSLYPITNDKALLWPSGIMQQVIMSHPGIHATGVRYSNMEIYDDTTGSDNIFYRAINNGLVKRDGYEIYLTPRVLSGEADLVMSRHELTSLAITYDYLDQVVENDLFSDLMNSDREWF